MENKEETLDPRVLKVFEDIIGADYISQEPSTLDGYCFSWGTGFGKRPMAAVLPGNVEEIQALVKAFNHYNVKYLAHSTGFGPFGLVCDYPFVSVDLRRLNKILEVDEKNKFAVVEPYVSFGALTAAAIKKGVRPYSIGAGPSPSVLANVTNTHGNGSTNVGCGWGGRLCMAVEWILPDGKILRIGSLGTNGEYWSGDGPGPSLRGILRGMAGPMGGLGIVTRVGVRLVPWYGPPKIESYGPPPNYSVDMPKEISNHLLLFTSRKNLYEALRLIQEENIALWCSRRGPFTMAAAATRSNREVLEMWNSGEFQKRLEKYNYNLTVGLDASSPQEMEFKVECLRRITEQLGGEEIQEKPNEVTARFVHAHNGLGAVKGTFRSTGGLAGSANCIDTIDCVRMAHELGYEIKEKYAKEGVYLQDGDSTWTTLIENHSAHMEVPARYDLNDSKSVMGMVRHHDESEKAEIDGNFSLGFFDIGGTDGHLHEIGGPRTLNYHNWLKKLKKILDPNFLSASQYYPKPDE